MADVLEDLMRQARKAPPSVRIEKYRDQLAQLGLPAIEAVSGWMADPELIRFAIRVISRAGQLGAREEAAEALESVLPLVPASVQEEVWVELRRLGVEPKAASKAKATIFTRRDPYAVEAVRTDAGLSWPGFQPNEFGDVIGTVWRRRNDPRSLPPIILRALRRVHPHFSSWPIYRSAEVHFAVTDRYRQFDAPESGWRAAKLVVYADGPTAESPEMQRQAVAGLYIEKGDGKEPYGPVDARWDWPRFVTSLTDPTTSQALSGVMAAHGMQLGDFVGERFGPANHVGGIGRIESGDLVFRSLDEGRELFRGWEALRHHLEILPADDWHNFHIWRAWTADEAVAGGSRFATDAVVPVLLDLARIYVRIIREALAEGVRAIHRVQERRTAPDGRPEIVFLVQAREDPGRFTIPRAVMEELDIPPGGRVRLVVETLEGKRFYSGELASRSGTEIYRANDPETRGLADIRPREWIRVTASKPAAA